MATVPSTYLSEILTSVGCQTKDEEHTLVLVLLFGTKLLSHQASVFVQVKLEEC